MSDSETSDDCATPDDTQFSKTEDIFILGGSPIFSKLKPARKALKAQKLKEQTKQKPEPVKKEILILAPAVPTVQLGHDVCVKGLEKSITESALRAYMNSFGSVETVNLVKDKKQQSRGFGFVRFKNVADAQKCVAAPHSLDGCAFSCSEAKQVEPKAKPPPAAPAKKTREELEAEEEEKRARKKQKRRERIANKYKAKQNAVFVTGLKKDVSEQTLEDYFNTYGKILKTHVVRDSSTQQPRGYAFVVFSNEHDPASAEKAVAAGLSKPHFIGGASVTCKLADRREDTKPAKSAQENAKPTEQTPQKTSNSVPQKVSKPTKETPQKVAVNSSAKQNKRKMSSPAVAPSKKVLKVS